MKPVLYEDDCTPDAREYFDIDMVKLTGMNHVEFQNIAARTEKNDGMTVSYKYNQFVLEYSGDDPFYILYTEVDE